MQAAIKIGSSICLALILAFEIGSYGCFYYMGRLERSMWDFFNPFIEVLVLPLSFLGLVIFCVASLFYRKRKPWTGVMLLVAIASVAVSFVLSPPGSLVVYGIRNRVLQEFSIDDLRRFAQDLHREAPNIRTDENDPHITDAFVSYEKLARQYSFMKWGIGGKGNPYITDKDGVVDVEWGGALPGHWGFSIALNGHLDQAGIDPGLDPRVLRISDDVAFYHGE